MDCAQGINFLLTNGGRMEDYQGIGMASRSMLPSVGVSCTAGAGSEAQSFALICRESDHFKMACGDEKEHFRAVILDPLVAATAPAEVAAVAGYDALSHAVESFVTRSANPLSRLLAKEAWRGAVTAYEAIVTGTAGEIELAEMMWGAYLAGAAVELSMLGAAHACANPLTAHFGVTHGKAIALMLPDVVRADAPVSAPLYDELTASAPGQGPETLAQCLEALRDSATLPARLSAIGIDAKDLSDLTALAVE